MGAWGFILLGTLATVETKEATEPERPNTWDVTSRKDRPGARLLCQGPLIQTHCHPH